MLPATDPVDFDQLLEAAKRHDRDAWDELYHRFAPSILGYLRSQRVASEEDMLSDVWLQVVRDLSSFTGGAAQFRGWLLRISHNRLLDERRSHRRRSEIV